MYSPATSESDAKSTFFGKCLSDMHFKEALTPNLQLNVNLNCSIVVVPRQILNFKTRKFK